MTTWNPLDKNSNVELSNLNLTATSRLATPATQTFRGTSAFTGKQVFAVRLDAKSAERLYFGVAKASQSLSGFVGSTLDSAGIATNDGLYHGGTFTLSPLDVVGQDDVVGVAFDAATRKVWFGRNGTWQGNPAAGTGEAYILPAGDYFPAATLRMSADTLTGAFTRAQIDAILPGTSLIPAGFQPIGGTAAPAWVTTGKLRRTPPLLVNPLTLDATTNEFEYGDPSIGSTATSDGISSIDNHYIVRFAGNGGRTSALRLDGFGRAWIMGGNWSGANASMQFYNIADEVYVEGVRLDPGPGRDGIFGRGLSPAKRGRVSIARSHILGITGTNKAFSPALSAAAVSRGDGSSLTVLELPASVSVTNGQEVRVWGFTGANAAKYNGSYKASGDQTNTRVLTLRYYNNSGVPGPVERDATGGLFALDTGANTSRHGDGVQIDNQAGYTGTLSLDYLTIESAYQGIIAGLKVTTGIGNDGLEITRSNLTRNNGAPEPRDFNSYPLWIGGSDGAASDLQAKYRVGLLDMVYVENGPDWPGAGMSGVMDFPNWNMHPQSGTTRGGQPSSPFANGGGWSWPNATVNMPSYTGADGIVFEVENGQLPPGGHFATRSVTGIPTLAAPGFGYVPHPANYAAMPAPANPVITFAPDAITASASDGTRAGLFDCSNLSGGYIVMLAFTADGNAGGRFKLNGRRLERTATAAAAGSYSVTIRATLLDVTGAPTGHSSTTSFPVVVQ